MINRAGLGIGCYDAHFRPPEHLAGSTVDDDGVYRWHQMGGIRPCKNSPHHMRFDYSVPLPRATFDPTRLVPDRFEEFVNDPTSNGKLMARGAYGSICSQVQDNESRRPLSKKEYAEVLTFSFIVDRDRTYFIEDRVLSVNNGIIVNSYSYRQANDKCLPKTRDQELYDWHQFAMHNGPADLLNDQKYRQGGFDFCNAADQSSLLASDYATEIAFTENVNCIHRLKKNVKPGSRPRFAGTDHALSIFPPQDWTTSATNTRNPIPALNILALAHFVKTGEALFSAERANALGEMAERVEQERLRKLNLI